MMFDASPCGWSGLLVQHGALACIADRVTDGATLLNVEHGSARSQQCAEVLAIRVDLRIWCLSWVERRITLFVFRPVHVRRETCSWYMSACLQAARRAVLLVRGEACFHDVVVACERGRRAAVTSQRELLAHPTTNFLNDSCALCLDLLSTRLAVSDTDRVQTLSATYAELVSAHVDPNAFCDCGALFARPM